MRIMFETRGEPSPLSKNTFMKKILLFSAFNVMLIAFGQQASFNKYKGWDETRQLAKKENKKIFLYFGATWCAPCKEIKRNILPDPEVQAKLKSEFVRYEFDIDQKPSIPFLKKYRISGVPLIIILNADGFVTNRISEIPMTIPEFSSMLKQVSGEQEYIKGISNSLMLSTPKFYDQYFNNGMKQFPDSSLVDSYLKSQSDLTKEANWNVLSYFSTNDDYFFYIIEHEKELVDLYGTEVKFQALAMYRRIAQRYIEAKDSVRYNHVAKILTGSGKPGNIQGQKAYLLRQILFLGRTGMDWDKFIAKSRLYIQLYGNKDIRTICQYGLESKPNQEAVGYLIEIMTPEAQVSRYGDTFVMYGTLHWYA